MVAPRPQRRLSAVLVTDVVGYSRLLGRDEAGTLAHLKAGSVSARASKYRLC